MAIYKRESGIGEPNHEWIEAHERTKNDLQAKRKQIHKKGKEKHQIHPGRIQKAILQTAHIRWKNWRIYKNEENENETFNLEEELETFSENKNEQITKERAKERHKERTNERKNETTESRKNEMKKARKAERKNGRKKAWKKRRAKTR